MNEKKQTPSVESVETEAKQKIEESRKLRIKSCNEEIAASLAKHGCQFDVAVIIKEKSITPVITVISVK